MEYTVIAFSSTHNAITGQKSLEGKIAFQIMPTPRVISSCCGISIRLSPEDVETAKVLLSENKIDETRYSIYQFNGENLLK